MYKALVYITLKAGILDAQGNAIQNGLLALGYNQVKDVQVGKYLEIILESEDKLAASNEVEEMCKKLLANTIIENYRFEIMEV